MEKQDIDKLTKAAKNVVVILPDVLNISGNWAGRIFDYGKIIFKHGPKALFVFKNAKEIGLEIVDLDPTESAEIYANLTPLFGGSDEAHEAIQQIFIGAAGISQGVQKLILLKNKD